MRRKEEYLMIPKKIDILGTHFSNTNLKEVVEFIKFKKFNEPNYVCFPSTNTIAKAHKDKKFQYILNNALLTIADGKFTQFYARMYGNKKIKSISGYWLMKELLQTNLSHFFYGCDDETLAKLKKK